MDTWISPKLFGAVGGGATDDTIAVQAWLNFISSHNCIGALDDIYKISQVTFSGSHTIKGVSPAAQFNLTGLNAGIVRIASVDTIIWEDFNILGDNVEANNQYGFTRAQSAGTLTKGVFRNINVSYVTCGLDLTDTAYVDGYGGKIGPTLGTATGHGYGVVCGTPFEDRAIRWTNLYTYRTTRHAFYAGAGIGVTLRNFISRQHRYGLSVGGSLSAALVISRGQAIDVEGVIIDSNDGAFEISTDDSTLSAESSGPFSMRLTCEGCLYPGVIGYQGTTTPIIRTTNARVWVNWKAPSAPANATAIEVFEGNNCDIDLQCDFSATAQNQTGVYVTGTNIPKDLRIRVKMVANPTASVKAAIELGTALCASVATPSVLVTGDSYCDGGSLIYPDAEIQNSGIRVLSHQDVKTITGSTPYVGGYCRFQLSQTSATNITALLGGYDGQEVNIVSGDGNSTFRQGSSVNSFKNTNGMDYLAGTNSLVSYLMQNNVWYQS